MYRRRMRRQAMPTALDLARRPRRPRNHLKPGYLTGSLGHDPLKARQLFPSSSRAVHPWMTWGVAYGCTGVVACGWMWRMPGGGSVSA